MTAQQSWIYYWHGLQKFVVFVRGLLTTLFNPKVSVLRGIIDLGALAPLGAVLAIAIVLGVLVCVFFPLPIPRPRHGH